MQSRHPKTGMNNQDRSTNIQTRHNMEGCQSPPQQWFFHQANTAGERSHNHNLVHEGDSQPPEVSCKGTLWTEQAVSTQLRQLAQGQSWARMQEPACSRTRSPPGGGSEETIQCCTTSFHYSMGSARTYGNLLPFTLPHCWNIYARKKITFPEISILQKRRSPYIW